MGSASESLATFSRKSKDKVKESEDINAAGDDSLSLSLSPPESEDHTGTAGTLKLTKKQSKRLSQSRRRSSAGGGGGTRARRASGSALFPTSELMSYNEDPSGLL